MAQRESHRFSNDSVPLDSLNSADLDAEVVAEGDEHKIMSQEPVPLRPQVPGGAGGGAQPQRKATADASAHHAPQRTANNHHHRPPPARMRRAAPTRPATRRQRPPLQAQYSTDGLLEQDEAFVEALRGLRLSHEVRSEDLNKLRVHSVQELNELDEKSFTKAGYKLIDARKLQHVSALVEMTRSQHDDANATAEALRDEFNRSVSEAASRIAVNAAATRAGGSGREPTPSSPHTGAKLRKSHSAPHQRARRSPPRPGRTPRMPAARRGTSCDVSLAVVEEDSSGSPATPLTGSAPQKSPINTAGFLQAIQFHRNSNESSTSSSSSSSPRPRNPNGGGGGGGGGDEDDGGSGERRRSNGEVDLQNPTPNTHPPMHKHVSWTDKVSGGAVQQVNVFSVAVLESPESPATATDEGSGETWKPVPSESKPSDPQSEQQQVQPSQQQEWAWLYTDEDEDEGDARRRSTEDAEGFQIPLSALSRSRDGHMSIRMVSGSAEFAEVDGFVGPTAAVSTPDQSASDDKATANARQSLGPLYAAFLHHEPSRRDTTDYAADEAATEVHVPEPVLEEDEDGVEEVSPTKVPEDSTRPARSSSQSLANQHFPPVKEPPTSPSEDPTAEPRADAADESDKDSLFGSEDEDEEDDNDDDNSIRRHTDPGIAVRKKRRDSLTGRVLPCDTAQQHCTMHRFSKEVDQFKPITLPDTVPRAANLQPDEVDDDLLSFMWCLIGHGVEGFVESLEGDDDGVSSVLHNSTEQRQSSYQRPTTLGDSFLGTRGDAGASDAGASSSSGALKSWGKAKNIVGFIGRLTKSRDMTNAMPHDACRLARVVLHADVTLTTLHISKRRSSASSVVASIPFVRISRIEHAEYRSLHGDRTVFAKMGVFYKTMAGRTEELEIWVRNHNDWARSDVVRLLERLQGETQVMRRRLARHTLVSQSAHHEEIESPLTPNTPFGPRAPAAPRRAVRNPRQEQWTANLKRWEEEQPRDRVTRKARSVTLGSLANARRRKVRITEEDDKKGGNHKGRSISPPILRKPAMGRSRGGRSNTIV